MLLRSTSRRLFAACLLALWSAVSWAQQGLQVIPPPAPVVDATLTLSQAQQAQLEEQLRAFKAKKGAEISVIIVPTTQPETIEQYAIRLRDTWKAGRAKIDDAAQLIVAKNDRKLRIEVGYGLEGALTDATSKRIISEVIVPQFKHGDFAGGIQAGVEKILAVVEGEPLPPPQPEYGGASDGINMGFLPIALLVALFAGGILRSMFGRIVGATLTGGLTGFVGYLITGTIMAAVLAAFLAFMLNLFAGLFSPGNAWTSHRRYGGRGGYYGGGFPGGWSGGSWGGGGGGGGSWGGGGGGGGGGGASGEW